jgi:peptidoglycan DL-endopeptidase CwlO
MGKGVRRIASIDHPMRLTLVRLGAVVAFATMALGAFAPRVGADPIVDAEAQATAIATKLGQLNSQLTLLSGQVADAEHNVDLAAVATAKGRASLALARQKLARRRGQLSAFAVDAYMSGGSTPTAVLDDFDGQRSQAAVRDSFVRTVADHRQTLIDAADAAAQVVDHQARLLAQAEADARTSAAQLASLEAATTAAVTQEGLLQNNANAHLAALINAEETTGEGEDDAMDPATAKQTLSAALATNLPPAPNPAAQLAVQSALSVVGDPYVWGGAGPVTFDCSGLVMWSYAHAGINLAHWTGDQITQAQPVAMKDLQPGDVIFMWAPGAGTAGPPEHVTMYIGNNLLVQAPHEGSFVEITSTFWWPTAGRAAYRFPVSAAQAAYAAKQPVPALPVPLPTTTPTIPPKAPTRP